MGALARTAAACTHRAAVLDPLSHGAFGLGRAPLLRRWRRRRRAARGIRLERCLGVLSAELHPTQFCSNVHWRRKSKLLQRERRHAHSSHRVTVPCALHTPRNAGALVYSRHVRPHAHAHRPAARRPSRGRLRARHSPTTARPQGRAQASAWCCALWSHRASRSARQKGKRSMHKRASGRVYGGHGGSLARGSRMVHVLYAMRHVVSLEGTTVAGPRAYLLAVVAVRTAQSILLLPKFGLCHVCAARSMRNGAE